MNTIMFQIYLLSRMRAREQVDRALRALGASRSDFEFAAREAEAAGFETPGHTARLYRDVLGPPTSEEPDPSPGLSEGFAGSTILRFQLDTWPDLELVVRGAPAGFAWGMAFDRRKGAKTPPLATVPDLVPWRFVTSEVTRRFPGPKSEDAWSGWEDFSYDIPSGPGLPAGRYLLAFDFELLQTIEELR